MKKKFIGTAVLGIAIAASATGCSQHTNKANAENQAQSTNQLNTYNQTQPLPQYNKSQLRQTQIDVENAQADGAPSTTFFFNLGEPDPISSCPSIGFPVASTDQLSNPQQIVRTDVGNHHYADGVVSQIDPTGVYTGDSTGTYVVCVNSAGQNYAQYWEGYVDTVTGAASWNYTTHRMSNLTNPTGDFKTVNGVQKTYATTVPAK